MEISVFSATQILREINISHFEGLKTAILTIWAALNFEFLEIFDFFKYEILKKSKVLASKFVQMTVFDRMKSVKIDFK